MMSIQVNDEDLLASEKNLVNRLLTKADLYRKNSLRKTSISESENIADLLEEAAIELMRLKGLPFKLSSNAQNMVSAEWQPNYAYGVMDGIKMSIKFMEESSK
jgi:hypothetical protein